MSIDRRRTEIVRSIVVELFESGRKSIRPGDVNDVLRERNAPMGSWEVRAEFTNLERLGVIVLDKDTADWCAGDLTARSQKAAG